VPIYEYQCEACHEHVEAMQKMSAPPLETCPRCGGKLRKMISSTSFVLKGSGWYATDYARKDNGSGEAKKEDLGEKLKEQGEQKPSPETTSVGGNETASSS